MCVYFFTTTTTTAVLVFHTYMASSENTHKAHYSYIPIFSVVTCNCNGDVIRCRRPMITYCNLDVSFLIVIKQFFNLYLGLSLLLKEEFYSMQKKIFTILWNWFCTTLPWWAASPSSSRGLNTKIRFMLIPMQAHRKYLFSLCVDVMVRSASNWRIGNRVWEKGHHYNAIMRVVPGRFRGRVFPFCTALVELLQFSAIIILSARDLLVVL